MKAKFEQNPHLKEKLMSYKGDEFRECTKCPFWGSGRYLEQASEGKIELPGYKNRMGGIIKKIRDSYK